MASSSLSSSSHHSISSCCNRDDEVKLERCLQLDDDPFVGLLTEDAAKLSCCSFAAFVAIRSIKAGHSQLQVNYDGQHLTQFGKRLHEIKPLLSEELNAAYDSGLLRRHDLDQLRDHLKTIIPAKQRDEFGVEWRFDECSVCFAACRFVKQSPCCRKPICQPCWLQHVRTKARQSSVALSCFGMYDLHCFSCSKLVPYDEALMTLGVDDIALIRPPGHASCAVASCPVCLTLRPPLLLAKTSKHSGVVVDQLRNKRGGLVVDCEHCHTSYCGLCGLAKHPKHSCNQLTSSDEGLTVWLDKQSIIRPDFPNGRRCPICKIPVSQSDVGCSLITCVCDTLYCYPCGRKIPDFLHKEMDLYFADEHDDFPYLPFISCPKRWKSATVRVLVHTLVATGLIVGVVPVVLAISPVAIPIFSIIHYAQKRNFRRA